MTQGSAAEVGKAKTQDSCIGPGAKWFNGCRVCLGSSIPECSLSLGII